MHLHRLALMCLGGALAGSILPSSAGAGIADSPLPRFADGKASVAVFLRTGVVQRGRLQTAFVCTSSDSLPVDIGVEIFGSNGTRLNDVGAGVGGLLGVAPGETVTFGASGTATFLESVILPVSQVAQGSARVVASSDRVDCVGLILDDVTTPPVAVAELPPGTLAVAGPLVGDIPLPRFADGTAATHAIAFPGAIKRGRMETNVFCTSLADAPVHVGVELLDAAGQPTNDVRSGNGAIMGIAPGATVTFSTTGTAGFLESVIIATGGVAQGLARVVSTSSAVLCSAAVIDSDIVPPLAMSGLLAADIGMQAPPSPTSPPPTPTATTVVTLPTPTATFGCTGDCDGSGAVTVDELLKGISIALGVLPRESCAPFDADAGGSVTVDEILSAVVMALGSCPGTGGQP